MAASLGADSVGEAGRPSNPKRLVHLSPGIYPGLFASEFPPLQTPGALATSNGLVPEFPAIPDERKLEVENG